jgi:rfaE bifunctional protein kinase chain/domain
MSMTVDDSELQEFLGVMETFSRLRVGVIGDLVADSYIYGFPSRLSREAPVMILRYENEEFFPGGAANTVSNLIALGAEVLVLGLVGEDLAGRRILDHLEEMGADTSGILCSQAWKTIAKMRFLAGDYHTKKQQVLRVDQEPDRVPDRDELLQLEAKVRRELGNVDAWVVSDYGYRLVSPEIIELMRGEAARDKVVVADSRYRVREFTGVTLVTPNEMELFNAYGTEHTGAEGPNDRLVLEAGQRLLADLRSRAVLVTRGNRGMALFEPSRAVEEIAISGTTDIVDVSGAGDTVVSAVTLALAGRSNFLRAARLANVAAGVKVMKRGTLPVSAGELRTAACRLAANGARPPGTEG